MFWSYSIAGIAKFFLLRVRQTLNTLGFVGHKISAATLDSALWCKSSPRQYVNEYAWLFQQTLFTKIRSALDLAYWVC